jgi:hypothetical protein
VLERSIAIGLQVALGSGEGGLSPNGHTTIRGFVVRPPRGSRWSGWPLGIEVEDATQLCPVSGSVKRDRRQAADEA